MSEQTVFAYVFSGETTKEILAGNAYLGVGGAKRNNGTSLEQGRPLVISRKDTGEAAETSSDLHTKIAKLNKDSNQLIASLGNLAEIKEATWLSHALTRQTYSITIEGFKETLYGLDEIKQYLKAKSLSDEYDRINTYKLNLSSYAGKMRSTGFSVANSPIDERLDEIAVNLQKQIGVFCAKNTDSILAFQIISTLIESFSYVLRRYSALYFCETGFLPANYETWVEVIEILFNNRDFQDHLMYHLRLDSGLSVRDCVTAGACSEGKAKELVSQIDFDTMYVASHSKEEYIALGDTIQRKIESDDYQISDGKMTVLL